MKKSRPTKFLFFLLCLVLCSIGMSAQSGKLNKANELFDKYNYPEAVELYKKILSKADNDEAKLKMADAYRLMNKPTEAEYWYEQIIDLGIGDDEDYLHYGDALKTNGKCELAKEMFLEFARRVPADTRGLRLAESCDKEDYFRQDPGVFNISLLNINSEESDFGPAFFEDGLVFASARGGKYQDRIYDWTDAPFLDLFYSEAVANSEPVDHEPARLFKGEANTWMHEGTVTFSRDENTMFFTRNNYYNGKKRKDSENTVRLKIYSAQTEGDRWGKEQEMPFNSDEYSVGHPTLSPDGQALYFVSDMPGGYGEEDIYVVYQEGGTWGNPQNLGPEINSEGREMFPFIHEDGTLYFASDALPGLGGLDVFSSVMQEGGSWTPPENLRSPINTNYDDFGLILNPEGTKGYFASNRTDGVGDDDIYSFSRTNYKMEGIVIDIVTEEPMEGVIVQLIEDGLVIQERTTFANGEFSFPILPNKMYELRTFKPNYKDGQQAVSTEGLTSSTLDVKIPMTPDEFGGIHCELQGLIYETDSNTPVEGATVRLVNAETKFEKTYVTGEDGTYTFELDPEMDYVIYATKELYFTATKRVSTKGRDCASPLMKDLALDIALTRIVVDEEKPQVITEEIIPDLNLSHIYYDLDKAFIRPDAAGELDKMVRLMYDNPGIIVELGSHTDSQGSDPYNLELSQRRAQSAVDYIVSRGIAADRIVAKGYGETQLVNECENGVSCADIQHQANRRTEFKIVGYTSNAVNSTPRYYGGGYGGESVEFETPEPGTSSIYDRGKQPPFDTNPGTETQPTYTEPTYTEPTYTEPTYTEPTYTEPTYTEPTYTEPTYTEPTYTEPTYTESSTSTTEYVGRASSDDIYESDEPTYFDESGNETAGDIQYKIQLGALKTPKLERFENLRDLGYVELESTSTVVKKVVLGTFSDRVFARDILEQVRTRGFRDAFLVTYRDGQRITY